MSRIPRVQPFTVPEETTWDAVDDRAVCVMAGNHGTDFIVKGRDAHLVELTVFMTAWKDRNAVDVVTARRGHRRAAYSSTTGPSGQWLFHKDEAAAVEHIGKSRPAPKLSAQAQVQVLG